ncbi:hypothetical protein ACB092_09G084000 [Castanea dentata]
MCRSNSSVSSRTGCPPDIVNEEDLTVGESEYPDFRKWNIPKISTKTVYDLNWSERSVFSKYRVRTVEQTFSISKTHEKCCLFSRKNVNDFMTKKNLKYLHIGLVQVAIKPLTIKGIDASVFMCLRDARFKKFNDSILGMITTSLYDGPVYFDCYLDLALDLDDPNIIKALTLNILTSGYDMDDGNKPFTLIYRIYYRLLDSQLTPCARGRDPAGKTMLIQCSTPNAKIQVPKMIQWQDISLPKEWTLEQVAPPIKPVFDELDLTNIAQYVDGTVKIFFDDTKCLVNNKSLRINEGRHSFAGSESFVKRNSEVDEFLKKNFEKPDLKLKRVASDDSQVSNAYYSTKTDQEEDDAKSDTPSRSDFPPIETPVHYNQLRVINLMDMDFEIKDFEIDMTIVRSTHPPLETVLINCKNDKESTEVKASPFKIADDKTHVSAIIEQNNFANESLHIIGQQLDHIEEKIVEKNAVSKSEKPLIDLPSQREKINFKTSQSNTFDLVNSQGSIVEKIEKMLVDLKVKTKQTSTSRGVACAISRNEKKTVSEEDTCSDSLSSDSFKNAFDDGLRLPEIKRFFEERSFQTQFFVSAEKLYEWNIDGLSEQEIINKMAHMSMVGIAYMNNHDNLDHPDIVDLLASGFTGSLRAWWDSHLTEESKESIKHAVKRDNDGMPIFYENINQGIPDGVNTLVYTILKHFIGTSIPASDRNIGAFNIRNSFLNNIRKLANLGMTR